MHALSVMILTFASVGAGETVLLDFHAPWCDSCQQMTPVVDQLAAAGHPIRKINVATDGAVAEQLGVKSVPCFVMLVNGREVDRQAGATSAGRLLQMLAKAPQASRPRSDAPSTFAVDGNASGLPLRASEPLNLYATESNSPGYLPAEQRPLTLEQRLLAASARLRVQDPDGHSFGTGTIVDASGGEALILTCAHIFRDSQGRGETRVDLFCEGQPRGLLAKVLHYDMERDVALVAVRPGVPVTPVRVAPAGYQPRRGDGIIAIGCSRGADPTVQRSHITDTERVVSPPTIQVAGQPVVGRSGGGLFDTGGKLIGVCYAADPQDNEGYYAALTSVHGELDGLGLSFVYSRPTRSQPAGSLLAGTRPPEMPQRIVPESFAGAPAGQPFNAARPVVKSGVTLTPAEFVALSHEERAALWAMNSGEGNLTCVVRVPSSAGNEEIVLKNVTPDFLQQLMQGQTGDPQHLTSDRAAPTLRPAAGLIPLRRPWAEPREHEVYRPDASGWKSIAGE